MQVIKYCLRTEEHHGWMMKRYQELAQLSTPVSQMEVDSMFRKPFSYVPGLASTAAGELQPVADGEGTTCPRGSSPRGGASVTQQAMHPQHERRTEPQHRFPETTRGFTHQLFSVTSSPEREHMKNSGGSGSSSVTGSFCPADAETRTPGRSAHVGLQQPPRPAETHTPAHRSHRAARLRAQGLDPAHVTRMGLACSEEVLAGCLAKMGGGGRIVGGPMAALAASLRGCDGSVADQEHAAASASSSSSKRRCSDISDSNMYHMQLKRSRDLAHRSRDLAQRERNGPSSIASQTQQDGVVEKGVQRTETGPTAPQDGSAEAHLGPKLPEEAEVLSRAQV